MASDLSSNRTPPHRILPDRKTPPTLAGLILLAIVLGLFLLAGGFFIFNQKAVTIEVDGQISTVYTHHTTVDDLLTELEVRLQPSDSLSPEADSRLTHGAIIRVSRAQEVLVIADGTTHELLTLEHVPTNLLTEAGITLNRYDRVEVDGHPITDPNLPLERGVPAVVEVIRAAEMTIEADGQTYTVFTTAPTIGEALYAIGLPLYLADEITPGPEVAPVDGLHVTVRRSVPITVLVGEVAVSTRAHAATVAEALAETGIALVGEDYSIPAPEAPLPSNGQIRVVRVTEELMVERTEIPYDTVYQADAALELDQQRILQAGIPGIAEQRTRIRLEDGVVVSHIAEPRAVTQAPVAEVIAYGTQIVIRTMETADGPRDYWRVIPMLATSYTPGTSSKPVDSPSYGISSTGVLVEKGIVAVDPDVIPYHTRVYVPGYGDGLAEDTGGAVNGRRIDLGYSDDDLVLWYSWVDVYLLTPVPPVEELLYILP